MANITLVDAVINGQRIEAEVLFTVHYLEKVLTYRGMEPEKHVTILPNNNYASIFLAGIASVCIQREVSHLPTIKLWGVEKDAPWIKHEFELFLKEYETEGIICGNGANRAKRLLFGVMKHEKTLDEDKLPKVKLEVSSKDVATLVGLLIGELNNKSILPGDTERINKLIDRMQKASKTEGGEDSCQ